jgi:hypothetical protein
MYSKIFTPGYINYHRVIVILVLYTFLATLNSCYTVSEDYISSEDIEHRNDYEVTGVITKNDSTISLEDYNVTYFYGSDSTKGFLKCVGKTATSDFAGRKVNKNPKPDIEINLDSVSRIIIEKSEYDTTNSTVAIIGLVGGAVIIASIFAIFLINTTDDAYHVIVPHH